MNKCDNGHKYGNYIVEEGSCYRECKCCQYRQDYPLDSDILKEVAKQEETKRLLEILLTRDPELISTSDSVANLIGCLLDDIFYIDVDNMDEQIVSSIRQLNNDERFFVDEQRYNFLSDVTRCFSLFFEKEKLEITCGLDNFPDLETKYYHKRLCDSFDILYDTSQVKSQEILAEIYDQRLKESSIVR